jgi:uncharacterized coiled-coil protein SlyX
MFRIRRAGLSTLRLLKRVCRRYFHLILVTGLILVAGLHLAATPTRPVPTMIQAQQFKVVNAKGAVVFSVRATEAGGRIEVRDGTGVVIFSAGVDPDHPQRFGLWEQSRNEIASQRRDLERQRRDLYNLTRRLQEIERQNQLSSGAARGGNEFDQYRSALARQDRAIDSLERQINRLSHKVDSLERRQ